jgi:tetratricopeptide (TPR) repeat protein
MINLALSFAAAIAAFLLFRLTFTNTIGALFPALVAFVAAYVLLARRTMKQLEALMAQVQRELQARKPERALELLKGAFPLARWQFLVEGQLHGQIGSLLYVQKKFDESEPHLAKSYVKIWPARAMLAAQHFRRKQWAEMERVFEEAVKSNKKEALLFAVYAWCQDKRGEAKKAVEVLQRGVTENPSDEKLKVMLQRAQNDKRLKMDAWGEQWWQFWLETPPMMQQQGFSGGRGIRGLRGMR